MDISQLVDDVNDQESFLEFLSALAEDRRQAVEKEARNPTSVYERDAGGWENTDIESYLSACEAWARDTDCGVKFGHSLDNPWKMFAAIFFCGKIYE